VPEKTDEDVTQITLDLNKSLGVKIDEDILIAYRLPNKQRVKARVHCFSTWVVMIKCFLLNPEKNFRADPCCVFKKNAKTA